MSKMKDMLMKILLLSTFYLGGCHANGVPVQYAMGVIYAVPAAMGLTIFVSLIVIMGMMCTRTEEAQQQHLTMESAAAVAMGVATDFDTDGGYAQISEVDGGGESLRL